LAEAIHVKPCTYSTQYVIILSSYTSVVTPVSTSYHVFSGIHSLCSIRVNVLIIKNRKH